MWRRVSWCELVRSGKIRQPPQMLRNIQGKKNSNFLSLLPRGQIFWVIMILAVAFFIFQMLISHINQGCPDPVLKGRTTFTKWDPRWELVYAVGWRSRLGSVPQGLCLDNLWHGLLHSRWDLPRNNIWMWDHFESEHEWKKHAGPIKDPMSAAEPLLWSFPSRYLQDFTFGLGRLLDLSLPRSSSSSLIPLFFLIPSSLSHILLVSWLIIPHGKICSMNVKECLLLYL